MVMMAAMASRWNSNRRIHQLRNKRDLDNHGILGRFDKIEIGYTFPDMFV